MSQQIQISKKINIAELKGYELNIYKSVLKLWKQKKFSFKVKQRIDLNSCKIMLSLVGNIYIIDKNKQYIYPNRNKNKLIYIYQCVECCLHANEDQRDLYFVDDDYCNYCFHYNLFIYKYYKKNPFKKKNRKQHYDKKIVNIYNIKKKYVMYLLNKYYKNKQLIFLNDIIVDYYLFGINKKIKKSYNNLINNSFK